MIIFHKIRYKNFLSSGNAFTEIDLDQNRSTLIIGENGSGKSTMLDALTFVLYGKPFRKVKKGQLINSINQKNTLVEVEFSIGKNQYLVRRGFKPNRFEIYRNEELIDQSSKTLEYQEILTKQILKLTYKSFCQVVILGNASFIPFMQLTAADRRAIIEDLLDIQIFSVMNTLLKDKQSRVKEQILQCQHRQDLAEQKLHMHEQHLKEKQQDVLENLSKLEQKKVDVHQQRDEIIAQKKQLEQQLVDLREQLAKQQHVNEKLDNLSSFDVKISSKIQKLQGEVEFFTSNDSCPVCKQDIDSQFKADILNKKHEKLSEAEFAFGMLAKEKQKFAERKRKLDEVASDASNILSEINIKQQSISHLDQSAVEIDNQISYIKEKNSQEQVEDQTKKYRANLKRIKTQQTKLKQQRQLYQAAEQLLKDGGVKSQIIKQYIPIINKLINSYLSSMQFFVQFELDENFKETIKSRYRDEFSYNSFSEGEKMRINLAVLFTWRTIAKTRNTASTNLLVMDEVFDSSLDVAGTDEFMKILNELTEGTNTFVISHKGEQLIDKFEKTIRFEKRQNFSRMQVIE